MTIKTNCPAEACLREWVANINQPAETNEACDERSATKRAIEDRASQVIARSDVGAAFQIILAITSWPWSPTDVNDREDEISEEASASLSDGTDYKRRLLISAYFHLTRSMTDADLREAERSLTAQDTDAAGLFGWLIEAQSTVDIRQLLAA
jgi:predicted sugar kinase